MPTGGEPPDTGSLAVAQAERVSERLGQRRAQASSAAASAQRWRKWLFLGIPVAVGVALLASALAVVIAVNTASTRAEDVAQQVTPSVTERVIADSRAGRADAARTLLAQENARLAARGLPIVADPGQGVPADEVVGAWITARVLRALPPAVTDELAAQVSDGRAPRVLPSATLPPLDPSSLGDIAVTVLPGVEPLPRSARPVTPPRRSSGDGSGPASPRPGPAAVRPTPAPAPAPAPAAPQRDRGLLQPCLLGTVLC